MTAIGPAISNPSDNDRLMAGNGTLRFAARVLVPVLLGLVWVYVALLLQGDLQDDAVQAFGHRGGTKTIKALIADPPMIVWWLTRIPDGTWQTAPLYTYHAILALLIGNAGRSSRWCLAATAVYAVHTASVLLAILIAGTLGLPRELVGSFDLFHDLELLDTLAHLYPMTVARCTLWIIFWQALAIGFLVHGWTRRRPMFQSVAATPCHAD